jgi:hypothetical protein
MHNVAGVTTIQAVKNYFAFHFRFFDLILLLGAMEQLPIVPSFEFLLEYFLLIEIYAS